ncbi:hypothetical protein BASA50_004792 [Batrachochytrium salamandrivorans]|uniref:G-protein coupled receptors family 1 profile domain-containing protein n=1 Tax=Batrachochytrium salamandrivorans TaxID=1357716 RepID=A0ABQ8FF63_9FUNG|nr:hypothetical protein BASA60_007898 [Batrachochytrium salamandrivorans]KAH6571670.1 hypothetical protein BASA62_003756 [Batrachochytrium salamandrivorans]KAH6590679.1 hypothetical protein BASA61_005199 [Batrachochytrium salamandrivorans]KAH6597034.1 hypothetical protein BASA50_004792 [Batrachochytrium salamandrivorans]KAH9273419.1 hypothetical protein BASA83_004083 [Batrachochytrium salamandrivorans]
MFIFNVVPLIGTILVSAYFLHRTISSKKILSPNLLISAINAGAFILQIVEVIWLYTEYSYDPQILLTLKNVVAMACFYGMLSLQLEIRLVFNLMFSTRRLTHEYKALARVLVLILHLFLAWPVYLMSVSGLPSWGKTWQTAGIAIQAVLLAGISAYQAFIIVWSLSDLRKKQEANNSASNNMTSVTTNGILLSVVVATVFNICGILAFFAQAFLITEDLGTDQYYLGILANHLAVITFCCEALSESFILVFVIEMIRAKSTKLPKKIREPKPVNLFDGGFPHVWESSQSISPHGSKSENRIDHEEMNLKDKKPFVASISGKPVVMVGEFPL